MPSTYFCERVRRSSVWRRADDLLTSIQGRRSNATDGGFTCRLGYKPSFLLRRAKLREQPGGEVWVSDLLWANFE